MEEDENSIKIVFLGDSGVGKTTIVSKFVAGTLPEMSQPTVGAAFSTKDYTLNGKEYRLLIWDTAGQELYRGLAPMYYRNALIAIIAFDLSSEKTFQSVSYWINELHENSEEDVSIIICGNKCDLENKMDNGEIENFAQENNCLYCKTSAVTGSGIERMFQLAIDTLEKKRAKQNIENKAAETIDITKQAPKKKEGCC